MEILYSCFYLIAHECPKHPGREWKSCHTLRHLKPVAVQG